MDYGYAGMLAGAPVADGEEVSSSGSISSEASGKHAALVKGGDTDGDSCSFCCLNTILVEGSGLTSMMTEKTASDPVAAAVIACQPTSGDAEPTAGVPLSSWQTRRLQARPDRARSSA